jgi:hypothetical protein
VRVRKPGNGRQESVPFLSFHFEEKNFVQKLAREVFQNSKESSRHFVRSSLGICSGMPGGHSKGRGMTLVFLGECWELHISRCHRRLLPWNGEVRSPDENKLRKQSRKPLFDEQLDRQIGLTAAKHLTGHRGGVIDS